MKRVIFVLPLVAVLALAACGQKAGSAAGNASLTDDYAPREFAQKMKGRDVLLLDVRTPDEFADGHLQGAVNIDWGGGSFKKQSALLPRDKAIFVYCASGARSDRAKSVLLELGFTEVHNMLGGTEVWHAQGLPLVK